MMKRILVAVTGLSPQIITESLYALSQKQPPFIPDHIIVLTTRTGAERVKLSLLSEGWFQRLLDEYDLPAIQFNEQDIWVITDEQGQPLDDIRSPEDNERVADQISAWICQLTKDENTELHVSLAGGRKTMGFYLGYALSLYGRAQDHLSHVLVSAGYEGHPQFYYPTRQTEVIYTRDNQPLDTSKAEVTLAEIPFVRMRQGLPKNLREGKASFSQTVHGLQKVYDPVQLKIDLSQQPARLICGQTEVHLSAGFLAFYAMIIDKSLQGQQVGRNSIESWVEDYIHYLAWIKYQQKDMDLNDFLQTTALHEGDMKIIKAVLDYQSADTTEQYEDSVSTLKRLFDTRRTKINQALQDQLGEIAAERYLIKKEGRHGDSRYRLGLDAEAIELSRCHPVR